ncbi:MAG: DUF4253 domain-containing protein [Ktedonobacteraceae bacterium]
MLDQQELVSVLRQHGFDIASLTRFALFEAGVSYRLTVKGVEAITNWQTLRGLVEVTGYWPVIVSNYENLEDIAGRGGKARSPQDIIKEGLRLDVEQVLRQYVEQYTSEYNKSLSEVVLRGAWPEPGEIPPTTSMITGEQFESVNIVLLPTVEGWHVPAYLNFGNWNWCPAPHEHVCIMKHWHELYGADLMGMIDTTIEVWVRRPPRDRKSALQLAWEQYVYCHETIGYDLVTNTIEDLAARLLDSPLWYFWWD